MKIAICSAFDSRISSISELTASPLKRYCISHGYSGLIEQIPADFDRPANWYKIKLVLELLKKCDLVAWVDADAVIRLSRPITDFVCANGSITTAVDCNGLNAGVLIVPRNDENISFLNDAYSMSQFIGNPVEEQAAIISLNKERNRCSTNPLLCDNLVHRPDSFIWHLPGTDNKHRHVALSADIDPDTVCCRSRTGMWIRRGLHGKGDAWAIKEVIIDNIYQMETIFRTVNRIVDIGAHIGTFATLARRAFPTAQIDCYEPVWENVAVLIANCGAFATIHPYAITHIENPVLMSDAESCGFETFTSFIAKSSAVNTVTHQRRSCFTRKFSEIIGDGCDLLKLDCEGCEHDILKSPELDRVGYILGELHSPTDMNECWNGVSSNLSNRGWTTKMIVMHSNTAVFHAKNNNFR